MSFGGVFELNNVGLSILESGYFSSQPFGFDEIWSKVWIKAFCIYNLYAKHSILHSYWLLMIMFVIWK